MKNFCTVPHGLAECMGIKREDHEFLYVNIVIGVSFVWLLVSFWNRNELPGNVEVLPVLAGEPSPMPAGDLETAGLPVAFGHIPWKAWACWLRKFTAVRRMLPDREVTE